MKKLLFTAGIIAATFANAQISGNVNYQNQLILPQNSFNIPNPTAGETLISVKGLANVKADAYVAVFSVTQVGKTQQEAHRIIDERISSATQQIQKNKEVEIYVDMVTFVPNYEYEVQNKIFSKKTYNEVPAGFEIKKNIHIKFTNPSLLQDLMKILSESEIYDLVRVDYHASNLENIKKEVASKARLQLTEKIKNYELLLGKPFSDSEKTLADGFNVMLPVEMYRSYEASRSTTLNLRKSANVNQAEKLTTIYYQPVFSKEFDFVINPVIVEPVIQVMYEIKMMISRKNPKENQKEYLLVSPNGEIKTLNVKP